MEDPRINKDAKIAAEIRDSLMKAAYDLDSFAVKMKAYFLWNTEREKIENMVQNLKEISAELPTPQNIPGVNSGT